HLWKHVCKVPAPSVCVRPKDKYCIWPHLAPSVCPHDPVWVEERILRVLGHRIYREFCQVTILLRSLPVLAAEMQVCIVFGDIHHVGNVHRADRKSTRLNSSHVKISYAVF